MTVYTVLFQAASLRKKATRVEEENDSLVLQLKKMATKAKSTSNLLVPNLNPPREMATMAKENRENHRNLYICMKLLFILEADCKIFGYFCP